MICYNVPQVKVKNTFINSTLLHQQECDGGVGGRGGGGGHCPGDVGVVDVPTGGGTDKGAHRYTDTYSCNVFFFFLRLRFDSYVH